ncbi:hypothetical protein A2U01_0003865, partial [Trifolium medium]|nr:hypothetical protein [Trifolium medium]
MGEIGSTYSHDVGELMDRLIENRTSFGEASSTARSGGDLGSEGIGGMSFDKAIAAEGS